MNEEWQNQENTGNNEVPAEPETPPMNGWSSDGSYRFVPEQKEENQQPPTGNGNYVPPEQPPVYSNPNGAYSWRAVPPKPPKKKGNGWVVAVAIIAAVGVIGSLVFLGMGAMSMVNKDGESENTTVDVESEEKTPTFSISSWDDNDGGLSTKEVVNRNLDSTVVLTIYSQTTSFTFGESSLAKSGAASGIVMSEDGYIITNCHCVVNESTGKPYDRVDVTTYDGTTYESAKIIGADESTDLAVIKIDAKGLSVAQFGDSAQLSVGDRVIALGNAAGLSWTATQGIISATARDVYEDTGYAIKCLQTDAAINPGNSGGALLNNQGMVVGINSSKIAANGYEGLGFSIPINEAKTVLDSLLSYGYVRGRVALGITGKTISSGMYNGFLISTIDDNSSLKGTAAAVGDLIVGVDDTEVTDYGSLRSVLATHKVGDVVTLKLWRSDSRTGRISELSVSVTLKEQTAN